ncbi:MAG: rRNA cytosine-C5-methyltransferase [Tannerella sp.]|jgi:16S rRNA C967 or C1407 C5-methylase (RsmB/RsmF family)/NOL1/NOP2/fmu family ribosome biogenesis protein|nr:rRNA cytosine-C5-methyltransferase [Tannerella sp.]
MLPQDFINRTKRLLQDEYDAFEKASGMLPPVSIRMNPHKSLSGNLSGRYEKIPWCETGYILPERPSFTFDPLFHAGAYYVQEASSMFLEQAVACIMKADHSLRDKITTLDLCAAPGGKSTHLLTLLPERSLLVSNETIRSRSMILAENITKWGSPHHITTHNDPKDFGKLKHLFDIILADLPCSGEGMFRKDAAGRDEWSIENVKLCASRQRRIIYDVWESLKPGGWLIYSTCTFNTEENEDNVYELANELGAEIIPIPVKPEWNIAGASGRNIPVYRFFFHRTRGEGFFLALMRKNKNPAGGRPIITGHKDRKQTVTVPTELKHMLTEPEKFAFFTDGKPPTGNASGKRTGTASGHQARHTLPTGQVYAIPEEHKDIYRFLAGRLKIMAAGVTLGEYKGLDFVPSVSLALNTGINPEAFPAVDLSYDNAIRYLQKESIALPDHTPKGYILLTYRHTALGFVKNIGNRANNLYPQEWRIRSRKNLSL